jgi:serine/threonine protein phosphatase PrpC
MYFSSRGISSRGLIREINEDSGFISPRIIAVADGMGGHAAGEVASSIAINVIAQIALQIEGGGLDQESEEDLIMQLPTLIDAALSAELENNQEAEGMGTTLSLLYLSPNNMVNVLHIGDSRIYKVDSKRRTIKRLTVDHTVANELFIQGRISADEVANHPGHSFLTQVLQGNNQYTPMLESYDIREGDRFLIASDGLSNMLDDQEIYETLVNKDESAISTLQKLVEKKGAPDNFTIIYAHIVNDTVGDLVVRLGAAARGNVSGDK